MKRFVSKILTVVLAFMMCAAFLPLSSTKVMASGDPHDLLDYDYSKIPAVDEDSGIKFQFQCDFDDSHNSEVYDVGFNRASKLEDDETYKTGLEYNGVEMWLEFYRVDISDIIKQYLNTHPGHEFRNAGSLISEINVTLVSVDEEHESWKMPDTYIFSVYCQETPSVEDAVDQLDLKCQIVCDTNASHTQTAELLTGINSEYWFCSEPYKADYNGVEGEYANVYLYKDKLLNDYNTANAKKYGEHSLKSKDPGYYYIYWLHLTGTPDNYKWELAKDESDTAEIHVTCDSSVPAAPTNTNLETIFKNKITVKCTYDKDHKSRT